jgi:hypothetical protein
LNKVKEHVLKLFCGIEGPAEGDIALRLGAKTQEESEKLLFTLELSVKSCPVGPELHPSFDASSPPGCCPQSYEISLNKGMKC